MQAYSNCHIIIGFLRSDLHRLHLDIASVWRERIHRLEALLYRFYERAAISHRVSLGTAKARMETIDVSRRASGATTARSVMNTARSNANTFTTSQLSARQRHTT